MRNNTPAHILILSLITLSSCSGAVLGPNKGTGNLTPNTVSGRVLDERGSPVPGVKLIIEPAMFRGTVFTSTGADGRYQSIELNPAANPYYVAAYKEVTYHGKRYCLRMAGDPEPYQEAFNARAGTERNFRWKVSGASDMPDDGSGIGFWGGSLELENTFADPEVAIDRSSRVEVTLVPDGPLIDGSIGKTVTRVTRFDQDITDIPAGYYTLTAALMNGDGSKTPLSVSTTNTGESLGPSLKLLFNGFDTCGHSGTFSKTHFWIARP